MKLIPALRAAKPCGMAGMVMMLLMLAFSGPVFAQQFPFTALGPLVRITSPVNHATFYTPVDIPIFAFARDGTVTYTNVEFYYSGTNSQGKGFTNLLGQAMNLSSTNPPVKGYPPFTTFVIAPGLQPRLAAVYCLVWTNAPVGSYDLTAVARGPGFQVPFGITSRTSAPVSITIIASLTNSNPKDVVSIVATDPVAIAGTNAYWVWQGVTNTTPAWTNWLPHPVRGWGYVTNWGPKNALFTVRRFGNASTNLTVSYSIGGTASNGVAYVQLPGSVTIPAGEAFGLIPVVPIDNNITNYTGTVILSLKADTNVPSAYTVGLPARAEAMIMDYWPRLVPPPFLFPDRSFHLNATGPDGAWFYVQNSSDMLNWTTVSTNQVFQGSIDYADPDAPSNTCRYYRTVPLTNTPAD